MKNLEVVNFLNYTISISTLFLGDSSNKQICNTDLVTYFAQKVRFYLSLQQKGEHTKY